MKIRAFLIYINIFFVTIFFFGNNISVAQPWNTEAERLIGLRDSFSTYWANRTIEKAKGYKPYTRWLDFWERRIGRSDKLPSPSILWNEWKALQNGGATGLQGAKGGNGFTAMSDAGAWEPLGPTLVPKDQQNRPNGLGRVNVIAFHPTNAQTFWVGTPSGGLWRTQDGGQNWTPLTDALPSLGVADVAVHASQPNTLFMLTGDRNGSHTYGFGLLKSTDGGVNWASANPSAAVESKNVPGRVLWRPNNANVLLVALHNVIYRTTNGGTLWSTVQTHPESTFCDMEFHPTNPDIVYASTRNGQFFRSTNGGVSWTRITGGLPTSNLTRMEIAVSPANASYVYVVAANNQTGLKGVYRSTDAGQTWTLRASSPNLLGYLSTGSDEGGQGWYDLAIAVHPQNAETVYVGGVNVWRSTNGGTNWTLSTHWSGAGAPYAHADCHWLAFSNESTPALFAGNDGGLYKSPDGGQTWSDLSAGLAIMQVRKVGLRPGTETFLIGAQDNGTSLYTNDIWKNVLGADGFECFLHPSQTNVMYGCFQFGGVMKSTNGGGAFLASTTGITETGSFGAPFIMSALNPDRLTLGDENVWRTENGGTSWQKISNFSPGFIGALAVAPSNDNIIYCVKQYNPFLYKTTDGANWQTISLNINGGDFFVTNLAVHATNPNIIWMTLGEYNSGQKVYRSTDGGNSWTNISTGLPNLPVNCIVHQKGGANDPIYVGTDVGVYYRDNSLSSWTSFMSGLPNVIVSELEIDLSQTKIYAATFGRGLWRSTLFGAATCPKPTNVVVSNIGSTTATINWQVSDVTGVEVSYRPVGASTWQTVNAAASPITLSGLSPNTPYEIRLRGRCNTVYSGYTDKQNFTTLILCTLSVTATGKNPTCETSIDGAITTVVSGGVAPITHLWAPNGATTASVSGLPAGTYSLQSKDASGCVVTTTVVLTPPPTLSVVATATAVTAPGAANGQISVIVSGGTPPYQYSKNNAVTFQSGSVFSGLLAGGYLIWVKDSKGCLQTVSVVVPDAPPCAPPTTPLVVNITTTTAKVTWTAPTGVTFFELSYRKVGATGWSTVLISGTSFTLTNLLAGAGYEFRIRSRCATNYYSTYTTGLFVTLPICNPPLLAIQTQNPSCAGASDGSASVTVSGGQTPYIYAWSNDQSGPTMTNAPAGNYILLVSEAQGCTAQANFTLTDPPALTVTVTNEAASCPESADGSALLVPGGGTAPYTFAWSDGFVTNQPQRSNLTVGTYTITVTDSKNCSVQKEITVVSKSNMVISFDSQNPTCPFSEDGSINASVSGGIEPYSYIWNNAQITPNLTNLSGNEYILTVTDAKNCVKKDTLDLMAPTPFEVNFTVKNPLCATANDGDLIAMVSGGTPPYSLAWSSGTSAPDNFLHLPHITAGIYTILIIDSKGCIANFSQTVTAPPGLDVVLAAQIPSVTGGSDGKITVTASGGTPPYTYILNNGPEQTSPIFSGLSAGAYSVTVEDSNGCLATKTIVVEACALNVVAQVITISCFGGDDGKINLTVSGGAEPYSFNWSDGPHSQNRTQLVAGNYSAVVQDAAGCSFTVNVGVTEPPMFLILTNAIPESYSGAADGKVILFATGGTQPYQYTLSGNVQTVGEFTGLTAGDYTYEAKDANGCIRFGTITVTATTIACAPPVELKTTDITDISAMIKWKIFPPAIGYEIEVRKVGETNALSFTTTSLTYLLESLTPNTAYQWRIRSRCAGGILSDFSDWQSFKTVCNLSATASVISEALCNIGGTLAAQTLKGVEPFSFLWSNGRTEQNPAGMVPAQYSVTVTDAVGCTATAYVTLAAATLPNLSAAGVDALPPGSATGSITATASGGTSPYTYALNNGAFQSLNQFNNLLAGTYTIKVRDAKNCEKTITIEITDGCKKPKNLKVLLAGTTTTTIGWDAVFGATRYIVRYKEVGGSLTITRYRNSPNIGLTTLLPGKQYEVTVWAECGPNATSPPSALFLFTTLAARESAEAYAPALRLYPNPNDGRFTVDFTLEERADVIFEVWDAAGRSVYFETQTLSEGAQSHPLELERLSSGVYAFRLSTPEIRYYLKFTITK